MFVLDQKSINFEEVKVVFLNTLTRTKRAFFKHDKITRVKRAFFMLGRTMKMKLVFLNEYLE